MYTTEEKSFMRRAFARAAGIGAVTAVATCAMLAYMGGQEPVDILLWAGTAAMGTSGASLMLSARDRRMGFD